MVNSSKFTKRLEKIIDYYGLTATAFSEAIDFNRSTISHLLSGRNKPSLEFVMKVVQTFPEVELYWLLNGKGSFPSSTSENEIKKEAFDLNPQENSTNGKSNVSKTFEEVEKKSNAPTDKQIERIVVFYTDGSFKSYAN